jgi:adenylate cyclase
MRNHQRRSTGGEGVTLGIGVNTGLAIAGNIGSERRMEYTVIGDEVNLAQRLESAAREGEILVSQATYERIKDRVEVQPRPPIPLKGKSVPVRIFEVVGLRG